MPEKRGRGGLLGRSTRRKGGARRLIWLKEMLAVLFNLQHLNFWWGAWQSRPLVEVERRFPKSSPPVPSSLRACVEPTFFDTSPFTHTLPCPGTGATQCVFPLQTLAAGHANSYKRHARLLEAPASTWSLDKPVLSPLIDKRGW
jgi:hypothetical protein